MDHTRVIALADRAAPHALQFIAAVNVLFLGSFLVALSIAVDLAQR